MNSFAQSGCIGSCFSVSKYELRALDGGCPYGLCNSLGCRAQKTSFEDLLASRIGRNTPAAMPTSGRDLVIRWMAWAIAALLKPQARLVAENLCLRQQLVVFSASCQPASMFRRS